MLIDLISSPDLPVGTPSLNPRCLVIGGGAVGVNIHVPRLLRCLAASSVTIVEIDEARRRALVRHFSREPRLSIETAVPDGAFDVAVVATPPAFHRLAIEAIVGRCPTIVIEKPLASTLEDGQRIIELCNTHGITLFVSLPRRTLGSFALLRRLLDEGAIPRPDRVFVSEGSIFSWNAVSHGSFSKDLNGGGVLMDTGPHVLDQLHQLFDTLTLRRAGMDVVPATACLAIEANAYLELLADGDVPVRVALSRNRVLSNTVSLQCGKLKIVAGMRDNRIELRGGSEAALSGFPAGSGAMTFADQFDQYYERFVLGGDNREVGPDVALKVQGLLAQSYAEAQLVDGGF